MKRSYSFFVMIGLFATLMFVQNPGFARSDQDIGFSMEIVSPHVGDVVAIPTVSVTPTAAVENHCGVIAGTEATAPKLTNLDDTGQYALRRQGWRVVYNFPIIDILPLSLPPPVKRE